VVRSGDTLWQLAAERYGGDPREGVWQIRARNGLEGADLRVGTVLFLPAAAAGS
jgi:nucleoid-associated protein YgaU